MQEIIIYAGQNEVIVSTPEQEATTIREYFTEGGRNIDEYDRVVAKGSCRVRAGCMYVNIR